MCCQVLLINPAEQKPTEALPLAKPIRREASCVTFMSLEITVSKRYKFSWVHAMRRVTIKFNFLPRHTSRLNSHSFA